MTVRIRITDGYRKAARRMPRRDARSRLFALRGPRPRRLAEPHNAARQDRRRERHLLRRPERRPIPAVQGAGRNTHPTRGIAQRSPPDRLAPSQSRAYMPIVEIYSIMVSDMPISQRMIGFPAASLPDPAAGKKTYLPAPGLTSPTHCYNTILDRLYFPAVGRRQGSRGGHGVTPRRDGGIAERSMRRAS